jgi:hypothetical protein
MAPARGDLRPCTDPGCAGTMQFRRESENDLGKDAAAVAARSAAGHDPMGWSCSKDPDHFRKGA